MGHILHHQGLNLDAELLHSERETDRDREQPEGHPQSAGDEHPGGKER
jgi:hypothetical protein